MGSTATELRRRLTRLEGVPGEHHDVPEALVHPHRDTPAPRRVVELHPCHPVRIAQEVGEGGVEECGAYPPPRREVEIRAGHRGARRRQPLLVGDQSAPSGDGQRGGVDRRRKRQIGMEADAEGRRRGVEVGDARQHAETVAAQAVLDHQRQSPRVAGLRMQGATEREHVLSPRHQVPREPAHQPVDGVVPVRFVECGLAVPTLVAVAAVTETIGPRGEHLPSA